MKLPWLIAPALAALLAAAPGAEERPPPSFEALDANKDGRVSVLEARKDPRVAARFAAADRDEDGYLSRAEFNAVWRR